MVFIGGAVLADVMKDRDSFWLSKNEYNEQVSCGSLNVLLLIFIYFDMQIIFLPGNQLFAEAWTSG